jgi:hypothetical protein
MPKNDFTLTSPTAYKGYTYRLWGIPGTYYYILRSSLAPSGQHIISSPHRLLTHASRECRQVIDQIDQAIALKTNPKNL